MRTYVSKQTVKARKVSENENIITTNGPVDVAKGDYVVQYPDGTTVGYEAEQFEEAFKPVK